MCGVTEGAPQIVLIPGFMQRGDAWAPVAAGLAESYSVGVLDFTTWSFEDRLGEILAAAPPGSIPVGYSMGGRLALHAALRQPDRFRALVLVGTSAGIEDEAARERRRGDDERIAAWMEGRDIEEVVDRWQRLPVFSTQPPELVEAQRAGRLAHDPAQLAALVRSAGQGASPPVWDRLAEIAIPVLLMAGERDDRYTQAAHRMARAFPNGRVAIVSGVGHAPQLEAPQRFTELLRAFLDDVSG
jgi:2-succinyl-6-hydroxy-2,4-cyclohexadiene-1-carboxylate synthase